MPCRIARQLPLLAALIASRLAGDELPFRSETGDKKNENTLQRMQRRTYQHQFLSILYHHIRLRGLLMMMM